MPADVNDIVLVHVGLSLTHNDPESLWPEHVSFTLSCNEEGSLDSATQLRALADAIEEGRVFGYMMQEMAELSYGAGEMKPVSSAVMTEDGKVIGIIDTD